MNSSINNSNLKSDHPEFPIENAYLKNVIQAINEKIENQRSDLSPTGSHWSASGAADEFANHILQGFSSNQLKKLQSILCDPYFGRFDFSMQGKKLSHFILVKQVLTMMDSVLLIGKLRLLNYIIKNIPLTTTRLIIFLQEDLLMERFG